MGAQIRFYTLLEDESNFMDFILSDNTLQLIQEDCEFRNPSIIDTMDKGYSKLMGLTKALIWVKSSPIPDYAYREFRNVDDNHFLMEKKDIT